MSAREQYRKRLDELSKAFESGVLWHGNDTLLLNTPQGWRQYQQECGDLEDLAIQVYVEESRERAQSA